MKECVVLAGGLGTRLRSVVSDVPKCMAEVAGYPFLKHLLDYLEKENFAHIILALGYKSESVLSWLEDKVYSFDISSAIEGEPLGTGGAIKLAFSKVRGTSSFVINGDTFFDIDTTLLQAFHNEKVADISIALKPMTDFDRYGVVDLSEDERITCFHEKEYCESGLINGGTYIINKALFERINFPQKFSFEKDVMEKLISIIDIYGNRQDRYFIDIGIPSDYQKANVDFATR